MGAFAVGQVVIVPFPFSDLTASKLRPAVVPAEAGGGDWSLCQITSKSYDDVKAITPDAADLARGSLRLTRYARPGKLFTAHTSLVASQVGELQPTTFSAIRAAGCPVGRSRFPEWICRPEARQHMAALRFRLTA